MSLKQQLTVALGTLGTLLVLGLPALASAATLTLSPASGSVAADATIDVAIILDTANATTSGTDVILRFDPNTLQVVDSNNGSAGVQIKPGSLYSLTSFNSTDNAAGKISFSGTKTAGSNGYSGKGTLATIKFKGVSGGTTSEVSFDFTSGALNDSNVIDQTSSDDVLTAVTGGNYTVGAGGSTTTTPTATPTSTTGGSGTDGGAGGTTNTDGTGGTGDVANTGLDLGGYLALTILALVGSVFFLGRRPRHR